MSLYRLPVVLEPQPEGGYTITCPLIPGLVTEADTFDEVIPNVTDALAALIEGYEALGRPLPDWGHKDLKLGTLRSVVRNPGLDWEEFNKA